MILDQFLELYERTIRKVIAISPDPYLSGSLATMRQVLQKSSKLYFSETSLKMLSEKMEDPEKAFQEVESMTMLLSQYRSNHHLEAHK